MYCLDEERFWISLTCLSHFCTVRTNDRSLSSFTYFKSPLRGIYRRSLGRSRCRMNGASYRCLQEFSWVSRKLLRRLSVSMPKIPSNAVYRVSHGSPAFDPGPQRNGSIEAVCSSTDKCICLITDGKIRIQLCIVEETHQSKLPYCLTNPWWDAAVSIIPPSKWKLNERSLFNYTEDVRKGSVTLELATCYDRRLGFFTLKRAWDGAQ